MAKFRLDVIAAPIAGGGITSHEYEAETSKDAVELFWIDVDAFGLLVSAVVNVVEIDHE